MWRSILLSCTLLTSACVTSKGKEITAAHDGASAAASLSDGDLLHSTMPAVDHHKHLMGPAIVAVASGAPIAAPTAVPAEVGRLLKAREAGWNNAADLQPLYLPQAVLLTDSRSGWITGADNISKFLAARFGRAYQITPVHYERRGNAAQLSGYYTRGDGEARQHLGYVHLSLVRNSNGRWQIAAELPRFPLAPGQQGKSANDLIAEMDETGVHRSVVLSEAFWADGPLLRVDNPYQVVKAENDWTAEQVARFPDRLIAFCSFNPVSDHALTELERCAQAGTFRGLKFSFTMSGVDLKKPEQVERLKKVFERANARRFPIVVHVRGGPDYGAEHVGIFLKEVLPSAPDVVVQIAHL